MKKVGLLILILILLVIGGVAAVVIVDPVGTTSLVGLGPQGEPKAVAAATKPVAGDSPAAATAGARKPEAAPRRPPKRTGAAESTIRPVATSTATKPAAAGTDTADATAPQETAAPERETYRKARFVGPLTEPPTGRSPHPELYPFTVSKRTYPTNNTIMVALAIRNSSGIHWKTAYVALRSSRVDQSQLFEIQDWGIDETVALEYSFPRSEVNDRMRELRVVSVNGDQRESALAELLARSRQRYFASLTGYDEEPVANKGGSVSAAGLLGMIGALQSPFTQVEVAIIEPKVDLRRPLRIEMPEENLLAASPEITLAATTEERTAAIKEAQGFYAKALEIQVGLEKLRGELGKAPLEEAIKSPDAIQTLAALRQSLDDFNKGGAALATAIARSRDPEMVGLNGFLTETSRRVLTQLGIVETAVKDVLPGFSLQGEGS